MEEDRSRLVSELRQRVVHLPPLPDEPDFSTAEDTLIRYLKSREWKVEEAARMLTETIQYRRQTRPQLLDCAFCHTRPGFHSLRQVGHDEAGRPVMYSSFVQASTHKNNTDDSVAHVTYLIENGKRTMQPGVSTCIFIIDCTGMTLGSCNPKLAYSMMNVVANHYPERLGLMIFVNHSTVFQGVWKAIKQFLHPNTAAKIRLAHSKSKMQEVFSLIFGSELTSWLQEEIALNKHKPLSKTQLEFWSPPKDGQKHDPRGCPSYVQKYLTVCTRPETQSPGEGQEGQDVTSSSSAQSSSEESSSSSSSSSCPAQSPSGISCPVQRAHKPHPNILDQLSGVKLERVAPSREEEVEREEAETAGPQGTGEDGGDPDCEIEIPSSLQHPPTALSLGASS